MKQDSASCLHKSYDVKESGKADLFVSRAVTKNFPEKILRFMALFPSNFQDLANDVF